MSGAQIIKPESWHARRAKNIGSSEVSALFDCQPPYAMSRYALYHVKAGLVPAPEVDNERVRWGVLLEDAIAAGVAHEKGWSVKPGHFCTDETTPGMSATLDFVIEGAEGFEGPGVLETKAVDFVQHKRTWTDGEPPTYHLLQLMQQMACTGYKWGALAGLVGGNRLEIHTYLARPKLIMEIRRRVDAFWQSIREGKPPSVDGTESASHVLRSLYPEIADEALDMRESNAWPEAVAEFIAAGERKREAEKAQEAARNRVVDLMAGHARAWGSGYSVACSVTPEKPPRPAAPGEVIAGRKESRTYRAKFKELT